MSRKIITLKDICNENEYFHEIELLLEDAKNNPVPQGTGHYHHIIPRSWYKLHKMMVDSRMSNLVYLSIENHYKIHDLMSKCMKEPEMVFRMKNAAAGLKDYKPNYCIKKTKIKNPKNKLRPNRGLWKNYLNNHIEELNKISFNNQIEYLNNLNPQIKYQVLRRIIENKFVYREAKDKVKMLKQGKIDEKLVLLWLN